MKAKRRSRSSGTPRADARRPSKRAFAIFSLVFARTDDERNPSLTFLHKQMGVNAKLRNQLENEGLLESEKKGSVTRVTLTDAGWAWAAEHLDSELPPSKKATQVLEGVLARLGPFLERQGASLAEFAPERSATEARPQSATPKIPDAAHEPVLAQNGGNPGDLASRLHATGLALGGGPGRRVRLSDVRRALPDVPREQLDRTLLDLQRQERLVLYRIDDPTDIRPEDEQAAVLINGNARHILYLEP